MVAVTHRLFFWLLSAATVVVCLMQEASCQGLWEALTAKSDEQQLSCESLGEGFAVVDFSRAGAIMKANLSIAHGAQDVKQGCGALAFQLPGRKNGAVGLFVPVLLTNLQMLEFDIRSKKDTVVAVVAQDADGASFNLPLALKGGIWRHVRILPQEFRLNRDSATKKTAVDPQRLRFGFALADFGGDAGSSAPNTLWIDAVHVIRQPLPDARLPSVIEGRTIDVTRSSASTGNIVIRRGGRLRVTAPRFLINGSVTLDGGTLEFQGTVLTFQGRFPHDIRLLATNASLIKMSDCLEFSPTRSSLDLLHGSKLEMSAGEFSAGFTATVPDGCSMSLVKVKRPGEFLLSSGSKTHISECQGLLIWIAGLNPTPPQKLSFPPKPEIDNFELQGGTIKLHIERSADISWAIISDTRTDMTVSSSQLRAVGLLFTGEGRQTLARLGQGQLQEGSCPVLSDRKLSLSQCQVKCWNLYMSRSADVNIRESLFGEVMAFDRARVSVANSTCSGEGGYVRTQGRSVMHLKDCRLECPVVAADDSSLTLENCSVLGAADVCGKATLSLIGTRVSGKTERHGEGKLVVH